MLRRLCVFAFVAALPLFWGCEARSESPSPEGHKAQAAAPSATPADAPKPADDSSAASADNSAKKATSGGTPLSRLLSREPEYREVTLPVGTVLPVELLTTVGSATSNVEDPVRARLRRAVTIDGLEALPAGSALSGVVTQAERSGRVKGRARVAFRFNSVQARDESLDVRTGSISRVAPATKKQDAAKIGIGAGAGAVIGGIIGGGDGAAKGAAIGGAGGTGVVLATRGKEATVPAGTILSVKLTEPLTVRVPMTD